MNWIQNDNQNVDGSRSTPPSLTVISWVDILFHNCFMSDDRVRSHVLVSVVSFSSSLVFFWKFCTEDVY